jgi:hypothetical protein
LFTFLIRAEPHGLSYGLYQHRYPNAGTILFEERLIRALEAIMAYEEPM